MSSAESAKPETVTFGGVTPVLRVKDIEASVAYYVNELGFKHDWGTGGFASVSRGRCSIFLSEGDQGHAGGWVWIGINDADVLLKELRTTGAKIRHAPTNYPWAYEMQLEDLDGNVLRLGSDPKKDQPTGEWLDMMGQRWLPLEHGDWKRAD